MMFVYRTVLSCLFGFTILIESVNTSVIAEVNDPQAGRHWSLPRDDTDLLNPGIVFNEPDKDWYISHYGSEPCVPLRDISSNNFERLYYSAGDMTLPEDYANIMRLRGNIMKKRSHTADYIVVYDATIFGHKDIVVFSFIRGADACQWFMSHFKK